MDSELMTNMITNLNLIQDNSKLDQQTGAIDDTTIQNRRSSSNSGESDVDSGIVAIEHSLSRASTKQLAITNDSIRQITNRYQESNSSFDNQINQISQQSCFSSNLSNLSTNLNSNLSSNTISNASSNNSSNTNFDNNLNNNSTSNSNISPKISSNPIPIQCVQLRNQINHHYFSKVDFYNQPNYNYDSNQLNSYNHNQIKQNSFNHQLLNNYFNQTDELDSEQLRNSCRRVLARINSCKQMSNDAIYANINSINQKPNLTTNSNINSSTNPNLISPTNLISSSYSTPSLFLSNSNRLHSQIDALKNCIQINESNQYAVPVMINCECLNCEQNKKSNLNQKPCSSVTNLINTNLSVNNLNRVDNSFLNSIDQCDDRLISNQLANHQTLSQSVNPNQLQDQKQSKTDQQLISESRLPNEPINNLELNKEDIKRLLLETLRQKNLEKEMLEQQERQVQMYLQERNKIIKERDLENRFHKLILDEEDALNNCKENDVKILNNDLNCVNRTNSDLMNNNTINKNVQYENTNIFKEPQIPKSNHQTYQNVPFHPSDQKQQSKLNDFTKSCIVKPTQTDNSIDDDLITKSFNGGYCSKETRKVLEGSNFGDNKKPEIKSTFLQKFSSKFSRAFSKAFYSSDKVEPIDCNIDKIKNEKNENTDQNKFESKIDNKNVHKTNESKICNLESKTAISLERTSNFIEKIKSIETKNQLKKQNKSIENTIEHTIENTSDKNDTIDCPSISKITKNSTTKLTTDNLKINENVPLDSNRPNRAILDTKVKKKNFELNLDEYCIIKMPDVAPKKMYPIEEDRKRCSIKKRNSINRKNCVNKCSNIGLTTVNKTKSSSHRHQSKSKQSKDQLEFKDGHVIAELIEINKDGSQVIELKRVPNHSFGFFLARGTVKNVHGVFVSRIRDENTKRLLSGLLEIGDQILSIDDVNIQDSSIIEVNYLMTNKNCIKLRVKPYTKS